MPVLACEGVSFLTLLIGLMSQELSRLPEQSETAIAHSHYSLPDSYVTHETYERIKP